MSEAVTDAFGGIYQGTRVLVTGHTGFKGTWLSIWLTELGAQVTGLALAPESEQDHFVLARVEDRMESVYGDIRDADLVRDVFQRVQPEVVFHLAAQSLVRDSYVEPAATFSTNLMGTVHVMEAIRATPSVRAVVLITSDKCYENVETAHGYREDDRMGGHDPYSASKGCAELAISSYRRSFFSEEGTASVASARAGNVIGGGDWSKDRIVPDCARARAAGEPIEVRNPNAVRPWNHVLEPLGGYLTLGARMLETPGRFDSAWNFGPEEGSLVTVRELVEKMIEAWGEGKWRDTSDPGQLHEANLLALDISKAREQLGWRPVLDLDATVSLTVDWYKGYGGEQVYELSAGQIAAYSQAAEDAGRPL